ncbi:MAG: hypothetical protein IJW36_02650 [Clostridia bacterium]|nr:hypothetical protein [Clostridia bacterium]
MEEEQIQQQTETVGTTTQVEEKVEQEKKLDNLPRIQDLRKSEKEIKTKTEIEGATKVESATQPQDRVFVRKADQKKALYKKRIKIVTAVYTTAIALLLAFVGVNIATLAMLNKQITTNTETIHTQQQQIEVLEQTTPNAPSGEYQISLNEPRDYSEDKKELTWLDKVTILFRNLFS